MPTPVTNRPGQNAGGSLTICDGVPYQNAAAVLELARTWNFKGGSIGPNGSIEILSLMSWTSTANNKEYAFRLAGTGTTFEFTQGTTTSTASTRVLAGFVNQGSEAVQKSLPPSGSGVGNNSGAIKVGEIDTALDFRIELYVAAYTAPEIARFEHARVTIFPG